jgi:hypothetical protein
MPTDGRKPAHAETFAYAKWLYRIFEHWQKSAGVESKQLEEFLTGRRSASCEVVEHTSAPEIPGIHG